MLFIIIFALALLLTIYIFMSLSNENLTLEIGLRPKSKKLLFYIGGISLFLLSSILYYELGSPFIDMNKLHTAKE